MSEYFLGEIRYFSFPTPPRGWLACNGQLLPINSNAALFSLLGNVYGGDGRTTFALPDLRGRVAVHPSQTIAQGQTGGSEAVTLSSPQLPAHNHLLAANAGAASSGTPAGNVFSNYPGRYASAANGQLMAPQCVVPLGSGSAHPNLQPYLTGNFCIATSGVFPSRQ
jgi:microcystin-dependent protein